MRRLRLVSVTVRPNLVWDDGDTLTPGPMLQDSAVSAADIDGFADDLRGQIADLEAKLNGAES